MMVKRCIGIDIGTGCLRAVQVVGTPEGFRIEKVFSTATRRASDSMPDILRCLFGSDGFDKHAEVAVSMPHDAIFFRNIQTDSSGLDQLHRCDPDALANSFPIPPEDIVAQVCSSYELSEEKYSVLIAAVNRASFDEFRQALAKAHIRYHLVETPVFGMLCALEANHPQLTASRSAVVYLDGACLTLAVVAQNDVLMVRSIPIALPSQGDADFVRNALAETIFSEVQITWQKAFGAAIDTDAEVFLLSDPENQGLIKSLIESRLNCRVTIAEPLACVEPEGGWQASTITSPDRKGGDIHTNTGLYPGVPKGQAPRASGGAYASGLWELSVAVGLALRILSPGSITGINFLDADKGAEAPPINIKKELATYSVLAGAFIVLLVVGLFVRLSRLESAYADVKGRIHDTFTAALPDEKNIVSPLAQMEQKLASFRKASQLNGSFGPPPRQGPQGLRDPRAMSPLQILRTISLVSPSQASLEVDNLLIAGDSARIVGTCDSFESVYQWQRSLQAVPGFAQVEVKDVQRRTDSGLAQFTILISFQRQEPK
jgi:hypothetical protein